MSESAQLIIWSMITGLAVGAGWLVNHMFTTWLVNTKQAPKDDTNGKVAALEIEFNHLSKEVEDLNGRVNGITLRMGMK